MAATYEPIATTTLGSDTATVTFSSIPATYTDLVLVIISKANTATGSTIRFNGDTSANYSNTEVQGNGSSAVSYRSTSSWGGSFYSTSNLTIAKHQIMNYTNTTTYKTILTRVDYATSFVSAAVQLWRKTPEAINSISIVTDTGAFSTGGMFTLYGIKAA